MADVLEQFLSGGQTSQPAKGTSVITDQLLDSLRRVESGKDRFAINKETKAMKKTFEMLSDNDQLNQRVDDFIKKFDNIE